MKGVSKLGRQDGTITTVPSSYWKERGKADPIPLYNEFYKKTDLVIIKAIQDDILGDPSMEKLSGDIKVTYLDGGHNFDGENRKKLIETVRGFL